LPQRCCSTLSAGLASCWRSCRLGSVQGCCQPGGSAMLSVRRPVGDAFSPALRWRRHCRGRVLATLSAQHRVGDAVGRWRHCASQSGISARSRAVGPASSVLASDDVIVPASLTRHHGPALSCQPGIVSRRRYGGTLARHHRDCVTTSLRQRQHRDAITAAASAAGDAVRVSLAYRPGVVLSAQHRFGLR
jgi:hypothetical protein